MSQTPGNPQPPQGPPPNYPPQGPPPNYPPQGPPPAGSYPPYGQYPPQGYPQKKSKAWLVVLIILLVAGIGLLGLMTLVVVMGPVIFAQVRDVKCQTNLQQIYLALGTYQNEFGGRYPDASGDLFLARLYFTGILTQEEIFICPEDKIRDNAHWVHEGPDQTAWKFQYPGEYPEILESGSIWPDISGWYEDTFKPWEISYAGRKNDPTADNKFFLSGPPREPTPIVSDDTENEKGERDLKPIHGDHINVLMSDGSVQKMAAIVGEKGAPGAGFDLEALSN